MLQFENCYNFRIVTISELLHFSKIDQKRFCGRTNGQRLEKFFFLIFLCPHCDHRVTNIHKNFIAHLIGKKPRHPSSLSAGQKQPSCIRKIDRHALNVKGTEAEGGGVDNLKTNVTYY